MCRLSSGCLLPEVHGDVMQEGRANEDGRIGIT